MRQNGLFPAQQGRAPLAWALIRISLLAAIFLGANYFPPCQPLSCETRRALDPYPHRDVRRLRRLRAPVHGFGKSSFRKYGFKMEHVFIRGSSASLAALMADEIQFLYCAADATLPALAAGVDVKLVAAPNQAPLCACHPERNPPRRGFKGEVVGRGPRRRSERSAVAFARKKT